MSQERRIHSRSDIPGKVRLIDTEGRSKYFAVRNLSDGGLLLEAELSDCPAVGSTVNVQIIGLEGEGPVMAMTVIRIDTQGLALKYI